MAEGTRGFDDIAESADAQAEAAEESMVVAYVLGASVDGKDVMSLEEVSLDDAPIAENTARGDRAPLGNESKNAIGRHVPNPRYVVFIYRDFGAMLTFSLKRDLRFLQQGWA